MQNKCTVPVLVTTTTNAASVAWMKTNGSFWADSIYSGLRGTDSKLYGLYWGALEHVDCLHFELAYYTPHEWALTDNIAVIEVSAQGEHKPPAALNPCRPNPRTGSRIQASPMP
jgi:predicted N-acyltransferase